MSRVFRMIICAFLLHGGGAMAASRDLGSTGDHVRVIIDTSKSMCGPACGWPEPANDPGRLSILSTILLHDLLKPDPDKADNPDSFAVIPFDNQKWTGAQPPLSTATPRRAGGMAARPAFIAELSAARLPFDTMNTYYAPGIARALADLPPVSSRDSAAITRTIVLITDGKSVNPEGDRATIEGQLLSALAARQARLYVIMFGPEAEQSGRPFFAAIERADEANVAAGRYAERAFPGFFIILTGDELPATMIKLFSESFGYLHFPDDRKDRIGTATLGLNLHRDVGPAEAAVVALKLDPVGLSTPAPPDLVLLPPPGGSLMKQHQLAASAAGGSYTLRWELTPSPGEYPVRIEGGGDVSLFVLRPTNLTVALREHREPPGAREGGAMSCLAAGAFVTMAERPCLLDFLVTSAAGTQGIPATLKLTYWLKQPRPDGGSPWNINDADGTGIADSHHWDDPAAGGRRYWSQTQFTRNQIVGAEIEPHTVHITVNVDRQNKTVAMRGADDPFEVLVYPRLGIAVQPPSGTLKNQASGALGRGERACTRFILSEDYGTGLESAKGNPGFNVRASLIADAGAITGDLRGARFTLDGEGIGFQSVQPQPRDTWSQSKQRSLESLVRRGGVGGEHALCVTLGPYADGDPLTPPTVKLRFILDHAPYDHFKVIDEFQTTVLVARAPDLRWSSLLPFLLLALGLLLARLLLRPRVALPADLGYAVAGAANPQRFVAQHLPRAHPLRLLFARKAERQVTDGQGALLGWVRPAADALYGLRPARGVKVSSSDGVPLEPDRAGIYLLQVHQAYQLTTSEDSLWFRIQFL